MKYNCTHQFYHYSPAWSKQFLTVHIPVSVMARVFCIRWAVAIGSRDLYVHIQAVLYDE